MTALKTFFAQNGLIIVAFLEVLLVKLGVFFLFVLVTELIARLLKHTDDRSFEAGWTMKGVVEVFLVFTAFQALTVFFKGDIEGASLEAVAVFWSIIQYLFLCVLTIFFVCGIFGATLASLGLRPADLKKDLAKSAEYLLYLGLVCAVVKILYSYEILEATTKITRRLNLQDLFAGGWMSWMKYGLVLVVSPVTEEIFYRGFMYPAVRNKTGPLFAIVLISFLFTVLHFDGRFFILVFLLSCTLCFLYETRRSLVSPIILHAAYNLCVILGLFHY
jgi:hypothetical protein